MNINRLTSEQVRNSLHDALIDDCYPIRNPTTKTYVFAVVFILSFLGCFIVPILYGHNIIQPLTPLAFGATAAVLIPFVSSTIFLAYDRLRMRPLPIFGKSDWHEKLGLQIDGDEPPLPDDIIQTLNAECQYSQDGSKVKDTHILVLIPARMTLEQMSHLMGNIDPENSLLVINEQWNQLRFDDTGRDSYWALIYTRCVDNNLSNDDQLTRYFYNTVNGYELPSVIEVAIGALIGTLIEKDFFFKDGIFTWCAGWGTRERMLGYQMTQSLVITGTRRTFELFLWDQNNADQLIGVIPVKRIGNAI